MKLAALCLKNFLPIPRTTRTPRARSHPKTDLASPGIGSYEELEDILPRDYRPLLTPKETQQAGIGWPVHDGSPQEMRAAD